MLLLSKNTTLILQKLRLLMLSLDIVNHPLDAYIVPSGDAHQVSLLISNHTSN